MTNIFTQFGAPIASITFGSAVALLTWWLGRLRHQPRRTQSDTFEQQRRQKLRSASSLYRWFEPLIDDLAPKPLASATSAQYPLPFTEAEFRACKLIESVLVAAAIFVCVAPIGSISFAVLLAGGVMLIYPWMAQRSVDVQSARRLKRIRLRMPFVVDQISLMMEAGAGFEDSLRTVVQDSSDHPMREELTEVLRQMDLGRRRDQALNEFRDRMEDPDISEFVFAIIKGEELGTPLSTILREQANQMRLKRSQWGEKAAAEAEVQIVFPGMISMIACLMVIIAPILLPAVMTFLEN
ncbi:MAG: type II secretion system F family protein [Planctomycetota bacterium]